MVQISEAKLEKQILNAILIEIINRKMKENVTHKD